MPKQVLVLTSTNLACNPRCLKEVRLLLTLDVQLTVVAFNLHNWTEKTEVELIKELDSVNFNYLESNREHFFAWLFSSALEKLCQVALRFFPRNIFTASLALSKRSWLLLQWIKKMPLKPDLIIAHNPPAFYPAYWLSKTNKIPFAIDVEDYHPGETGKKVLQESVKVVMKKIIPESFYTSYASPLIKDYSEKILARKNPSFVINNFFSENDFSFSVGPENDKLQLVWFSQNIDAGRGLEEFIPAWYEFNSIVDLTLIGSPNDIFCGRYIKNRTGLTVIDSVHPDKLNKMICTFDVGLAIEPAKDLNNRIALSNKILTYFQAGLYIVASDTEAQNLFMQQHPQHGLSCSLSETSLTDVLKTLIKNKEQIRSTKKARFQNASLYNWENESSGLLKQWQKALY